MKKTKFEHDCERVAERCEITVMFVHGEPYQKPFEDDGALHVVRRGVRAVFDVSRGQDAGPAEQNAMTRMVMDDMGMAHHVGPRVLVEENCVDDLDAGRF